jgi:hypothetical protein
MCEHSAQWQIIAGLKLFDKFVQSSIMPEIRPGDMLEKIGRALYGARWRLPLARALRIHETQLRRWQQRSGDLQPDDPLFDAALKLLRRDAHEVETAIAALERWRHR